MAVNINQILPPIPYSSNDERLIPSTQVEAAFNPSTDYIEYVVSTTNSSFQTVDYNYNTYSFPTNGTVTSNNINSIEIDPTSDLSRKGITSGDYNVYYNFYRNYLRTSPTNQNLFIKEISADRTELKLNFLNNIPVGELESFKALFNNNLSFYFEDYYLNFGNNILALANNFDYNPTTLELIINLYQPLTSNVDVNSPLWIVTKIADSLAFNINYTPEPITPPIVTFGIKGPNFNLNIQDRINNSTDYTNYNLLLSNTLTSSVDQIKSILEEKAIDISLDYTDFSNFIHFSSAEVRLNNFYYKVKQIETYNNELDSLSNVISSQTSSIIIQNKITDIIQNFDGYEYYMYYESGSYTWPKSSNTVPYSLYSTSSVQVSEWLGSSDPTSAYYGGRLLSASIYDKDNQDYLYYAIPEYIRDDERNAPYYSFIQLVGQHYDYIWTYYKDVTNRYKADNRLNYGISKDLVAEALKSFGVKVYQNNFTSDDLFNAFTGFNLTTSGSGNVYVTSSYIVEGQTGYFEDDNPLTSIVIDNEIITNYITASYESSVTPIDDYNKEVYKRIYHNLPYLAKTKGTIPGLRALINCFGVPDTILRISEFGGRDKDTSTYDYFDQQFNYALDNIQSYNWISSSFTLNSNWGAGNNKPESIQLRIKPYTTPYYEAELTQSLFEISGSSGGYTTNLTLWYTGSGLNTSSYSGSTVDPYYQYGTLKLDIKGNLDSNYTCSIYAPFFDGNWWSIQINRSGSFGVDPNSGAHTFTLFAGSTGYYDGYDGNQIMSLYSSSTPTNTPTWGYSGSKITFFDYPTNNNYNAIPFVGLSQEIRYWAATSSISSFKDYVMNPQSIDLTGENTYSNKLAARLPLGGDLYTGSRSVHPKITGSWATTSSFASNSNFTTYKTLASSDFTTNVEPRFLNSPIVGLKGRVTDKIQIVSSSLPTGSVLSQYTSIEQSYPSLGSESPDVNMLEIAFSPQNEVNDDIIDSLGYFNIGEYIGDPRQVSSSATSYPDLNTLSNNFFQKYFDTYDLKDYVRLIKYFDNSLFKMIKDFVPARTGLTTGVVIKQHLLERNKYPQPQVDDTQYQNLNITSSGGILSSSFNYGEDLTYTGSIDTAFMSGGTGGTFDQYNILIPEVGVLSTEADSPLVYSLSPSSINSTSSINYFAVSSSTAHYDNRNIQNQIEFVNGEMITYFNGKIIVGVIGAIPGPIETVTYILSSSIQGQITSSTITSGLSTTQYSIYSPYISCSNEERFSVWMQGSAGSIPTLLSNTYFGIYEFLPYSEQTWPQYYTGSTGVSTIIHSTQDEFYNGELPGTEIIATTGELNPENSFKSFSTKTIDYTPTLYTSSITTNVNDFLNINTTPNAGEMYLYSRFRVSYVKINKIDSNGTDQSSLLSQLQSLTVSFNGTDYTMYVGSIQQQADYYLYGISQSPNSSDLIGNVNDYSFLVSTSSYYVPLLTDPPTLPSNFNLLAGNTLNYFNTSSGVWRLGDTPNRIIKIQVSGSANIPSTDFLLLQVQANNNLIGSAVLLASGTGSNLTFNTTLTFSSSFYYPIENDNIYISLVRAGGGPTAVFINNLYISASLLNSSPYDAPSSLVIFNPSFDNFDYNDYNPLLDNADIPQNSTTWMDVDYSQNPLTPINFGLIISGTADRAFVQDSNYSSKSWSNLRYNGSRTNSYIITQ